MPLRTVFSTGRAQNTTLFYQCQLQDELQNPIPASSLFTFTLTVYAIATGNPLVNNVDHINILNDGLRGVVDVNGNVFLTLTPADMALVSSPPATEQHILLIEWTYGVAGAKKGTHEVQIPVVAIVRT
jgi:hypothetical protein